MRQSIQVDSGTAREEAWAPGSRGGTTTSTLKDPSDLLPNLASPRVGVPPEPVTPAVPLSQPASELLERLDRLRSAAGNSRRETDTLVAHAGGLNDEMKRAEPRCITARCAVPTWLSRTSRSLLQSYYCPFCTTRWITHRVDPAEVVCS